MLYITQNTVRNKAMYINNNNYVETKPVQWPMHLAKIMCLYVFSLS